MSTSEFKSQNCKDNKQVTSVFHYVAHDSADPNKVHQSTMFSCQHTDHSNPDSETSRSIYTIAKAKLNTDTVEIPHIHGIPLKMQGTEKSAKEISKRRMASNCAPHYNLNEITSYNKFTCRYLGKGVDEEGNEVQNPFQTWRGTLPSCDDGIEISKETEHDIKKLAWHAAGGEEAKMDVNQFLCHIHSIPIQ